MDFQKNITDLIGNTPLIKLNHVGTNLKARVFAKLESYNPGGSIKDRTALSMINNAESQGILNPGSTIIEATSGNTGIGLALISAVRGYNTIFVVTDKVSKEKVNYLKALGSKVVVVSNLLKKDHPSHYMNTAIRLANEIPNAFFINQYSNASNPEAHYRTTGPEIWKQTEGKITHFVAAIGTGGTVSGTGRYLKEMNPEIKIIGAEPLGSVFKTYFEKGILEEGKPYLVEAIGQNYIPDNLQFDFIDRIIDVNDFDSFTTAKMLTLKEGIFCGASTGTCLCAALETAKDLDENAVVVFIVCDTGERYVSKFHNAEWLNNHFIIEQAVDTDELSERLTELLYNN
ncbi:MAG: PLP-dependent cysteine synthase family protein [Bacillota bacterium]